MTRRTLARSAAALLAGGLGVSSLVASTGSAAAAGPGAAPTFQVNISVGGQGMAANRSGGALRIAASLYAGSGVGGFPGGSLTYQESSCFGGVPCAASGEVHSAGDGGHWFDNTTLGWLVITGVQTAYGPVTVKVPDRLGHYTYPSLTNEYPGHPLFTSEVSNPEVASLNMLPGQGEVAP